MNLTETINYIRSDFGKSDQQIADDLGITKTQVWRMRTGKGERTSPENARKLADMFGLEFIEDLTGQRFEKNKVVLPEESTVFINKDHYWEDGTPLTNKEKQNVFLLKSMGILDDSEKLVKFLNKFRRGDDDIERLQNEIADKNKQIAAIKDILNKR